MRQIQLRRESNREYLGIYGGKKYPNEIINDTVYNKAFSNFNNRLNRLPKLCDTKKDNDINNLITSTSDIRLTLSPRLQEADTFPQSEYTVDYRRYRRE